METIPIHFKLVVNPNESDIDGQAVVFFGHEMTGHFAELDDKYSLPGTAVEAVKACIRYGRRMIWFVSDMLGRPEDTERYKTRDKEYQALIEKIEAGTVRTVYSRSVERYSIREDDHFDDEEEPVPAERAKGVE